MFYQTVANISYSSVFTLLILSAMLLKLMIIWKKQNERDFSDKII